MSPKGGKTRPLDLHNQARRALYLYLALPATHTEAREPDKPYVFTSQRAAWLRQQQHDFQAVTSEHVIYNAKPMQALMGK